MSDSPLLLLGDCREVLRELDSESVDTVITDPPYGLGAEPRVEDVLRAWLADEVYVPKSRSGFMSKEWDAFVPDLAVWRECFRVLKPGGYLLTFSGTRTVDLVGIGLRLAGFERRDLIAWLYGSGFPKSLDVAKAINARLGAEGTYGAPKTARHAEYLVSGYGTGKHDGWDRPWMDDADAVERTAREYLPGSEQAADWKGWGTALKPAVEPIVVARKPLVGTVAENVLAYGTGGLNVDACRVGTTKDVPASPSQTDSELVYGAYGVGEGRLGSGFDADVGRWPANVVLCHADDCALVGYREVPADGHWPSARPSGSQIAGASGHAGQGGLAERVADGETVEVWECAPDCPVRMLDSQTGELRSGAPGTMRLGENRGAAYGAESRPPGTPMTGYGDAGGASRFFYTAKASRAERSAGLDDTNDHPTVKPIALMRWLVRLVARPGAVVCDPFLGSGTTGVACALEGVDFVGVERDPDYLAVADARIRFWAEHGEDALRVVADRDAADRQRREREDAGQLDLFAAET